MCSRQEEPPGSLDLENWIWSSRRMQESGEIQRELHVTTVFISSIQRIIYTAHAVLVIIYMLRSPTEPAAVAWCLGIFRDLPPPP